MATGDEQARFLGRVTGYTSDPSRGLHGEGQALTPSEQRHYSQIARRRDVARLHAAWMPRREVILAEVDAYMAVALPARLRKRVAAVARMTRVVDRAFAELDVRS